MSTYARMRLRTRSRAVVMTAIAGVLIVLAASCDTGSDDSSDRAVSSPTRSPARRAELSKAKVKLTTIAKFNEPVAMAMRRDDPTFYIAGRHNGEIRPFLDGEIGKPILDIGDEVAQGGEQGLLGLTFSPEGDKLYVSFTSRTGSGDSGDDVVRVYNFDGRATSPRDVLRVPDPFPVHNGGNIQFGPDGYLYIGLGDGGGTKDPNNRAQDLNQLLGKMLRIDPDPRGKPDCGKGDYSIPDDNPFVGKTGCDEIWAYGLRNPWRWSFDRETGALWIGDVGQYIREEINVARADSDGGENYGWDLMEGKVGTPPSNHHAPIYEYMHDGANCAVTGGYVYRGSRIADLRGAYVFGDHCTGEVRAFVNRGGQATGHRVLGKLQQISSFGQSTSGELYVMSLAGELYRIDPA